LQSFDIFLVFLSHFFIYLLLHDLLDELREYVLVPLDGVMLDVSIYPVMLFNHIFHGLLLLLNPLDHMVLHQIVIDVGIFEGGDIIHIE
jgi:hypothetical protein